MTDYIAITNNQVEPDAPLTSSLGSQFRDNPIAMFEVANSSPVNQWAWHPYDMVNVGDGSKGELWNNSTDGSTSTITSPVFSNQFEYRLFLRDVRVTGGANSEFMIEFYKSSDASWQGAAIMNGNSTSPNDIVGGVVELNHPGVIKTAHFGTAHIAGQSQSSNSFTESMVVGFFDSNNQIISRVRLRGGTGKTFNGGIVYLYKRKDPFYLS